MSVYSKLASIQQQLKVSKENDNTFAGFKYRTCSDILLTLKPLLSQTSTTLVITDELEVGNNRNYIKATVTFIDIETGEVITSSALAREAEKKTKMDDAQITGSSSSYARKYALCGLFCIDDSIDPDGLAPEPAPTPKLKPNKPNQQNQQNQQISNNQIKCQNCNCDIFPVEANGKVYSVEKIIKKSMKIYNRQLCMNCYVSISGGNQ